MSCYDQDTSVRKQFWVASDLANKCDERIFNILHFPQKLSTLWLVAQGPKKVVDDKPPWHKKGFSFPRFAKPKMHLKELI